jgi:hypothetical protein
VDLLGVLQELQRAAARAQRTCCFRPFREYLAVSDLSPKTIQKHVDNVGALGGEFIRGTSTTILLCERSQDAVLAE